MGRTDAYRRRPRASADGCPCGGDYRADVTHTPACYEAQLDAARRRHPTGQPLGRPEPRDDSDGRILAFAAGWFLGG